MKIFGFKGGIHPPENKIQTENKAIENVVAPKMLYIPLLQNIGVPCTPLVKVGDSVLKGQKIADTDAFVSSPIHASVSGTVKKIEEMIYPLMGKVMGIVVENDEKDEWAELSKIEKWESASKEELLSMIRDKGIVGLGGAGFPTQIKLNPPADNPIDILIINGAECEPYLSSDNRVMIEESEKIIGGIKIMKKILNPKDTYIGIEDNKPVAIETMKNAVKGTDIQVVALKTQYPQGAEKQLIKAVVNREVPPGKLPCSIGVVVNNSTTAAAVYEGIVEGKPLISKVVTVTGGAVKDPKNLRVPIGMTFGEILAMCQFKRNEAEKIVMGGPMMGTAQYTEDVPVIKGVSGILGLTKKEINDYRSRQCIVCGKCVSACPLGLVPLMFARLGEHMAWEQMNEYNVMDCMQCGSCQYICPSNRPLTESITLGKAKIRMQQQKK